MSFFIFQSSMENSNQPIDRLCVGDYQLLCLPNELCLTSIKVNSSHFVYYSENKCAVIKQVDFNDLLHFFFQCCQILEKKPTNFEHKLSLQQISCALIITHESTELQIQSTNNLTCFTFSRPFIPLLISAVTKLVFKSYCYSHAVNYTISKYLTASELEIIKEPDLNKTFLIFDSMNCVTIDYYLLFDIVERHKKLLGYIKPLLMFNQHQ